jgi:hypothetical protein
MNAMMMMMRKEAQPPPAREAEEKAAAAAGLTPTPPLACGSPTPIRAGSVRELLKLTQADLFDLALHVCGHTQPNTSEKTPQIQT